MILSRGWWSRRSSGGFIAGLVGFMVLLCLSFADLSFVGENRCGGLVGFVFC